MSDYKDYISIDPKVQFGKPCIKGTGIPTEMVFSRFMSGETVNDLWFDYFNQESTTSRSRIEAAIRYEVEHLQTLADLVVKDGGAGVLVRALEEALDSWPNYQGFNINSAGGKRKTALLNILTHAREIGGLQ